MIKILLKLVFTLLQLLRTLYDCCYHICARISVDKPSILIATAAVGSCANHAMTWAILRCQERIICMHGPITEQMASLVTAQLLFLESEDPGRPINMYINRRVLSERLIVSSRLKRPDLEVRGKRSF